MREESHSVCVQNRQENVQAGIGQRVRILHSDFSCLGFFFMRILVASSSPSPSRDEDFPVIAFFFFFFFLSVGDALRCPYREVRSFPFLPVQKGVKWMKWFLSYSFGAYLVGAAKVWGLTILSGGPPAFANNSSVSGLAFFSTKHFVI